MSDLRYFNAKGREQWASWLEMLKTDSSLPFPDGLLTNQDLTHRAPVVLNLGQRTYNTRLELAEALAPVIILVREARLPADRWPGLWDWLAAFHFDSICAKLPNGNRALREAARYAFNADYKRKYRHRILGPVELFLRLGMSCRVLLSGAPSVVSDWEEQTAARQLTTSHKGIGDVLDYLYWDKTKNAPKKSAAPNTLVPGTLRRFDAVLKQLYRTYDLLSIDGEAMLKLLPKEFVKFMG